MDNFSGHDSPRDDPPRDDPPLIEQSPRRKPRRAFQFGLLSVLLIMLVAGLLAALIGIPLARRQREALLRHNLLLIGLAFHNYHSAYQQLPPAYFTDAQGKPTHSWRVILAPMLNDPEAQEVAQRYDFNQPWDSPYNRAVTQKIPHVFRNPLRKSGKADTDYMVITGPGTLFEGPGTVRFADVKDGLSNTLLVVEVVNSGTHWAEPTDLRVEEMPMAINARRDGRGIAGIEIGRAMVAFSDGYVKSLPRDFPAEKLRALITRRGGEVVNH